MAKEFTDKKLENEQKKQQELDIRPITNREKVGGIEKSKSNSKKNLTPLKK